MKKESEKVGLKLNIQKSKIMASSPNTSWQIDGETVADFFFWALKLTNVHLVKAMVLDISPGCSLEGLMLKLKLQYFGHLMRRSDSFEKTLMLGRIEGWKRRG